MIKLNLDETKSLSDSKTNGPLSPLERSGKIQIIKNNKQLVDFNLHMTALYKSGSAGTIVLNPDNIKALINSKTQSPSKTKGSARISGKKKQNSKQIFQTSDRISYNFNKIDPFSTKARKSITESIRDAQK